MDDYLKIQARVNDSDFQKKVKISAIKNATGVIATSTVNWLIINP